MFAWLKRIADSGPTNWFLEGAPTKGGGHTDLFIIRKRGSKVVDPKDFMSKESYDLLTDEQKGIIKADLKSLGYLLQE